MHVVCIPHTRNSNAFAIYQMRSLKHRTSTFPTKTQRNTTKRGVHRSGIPEANPSPLMLHTVNIFTFHISYVLTVLKEYRKRKSRTHKLYLRGGHVFNWNRIRHRHIHTFCIYTEKTNRRMDATTLDSQQEKDARLADTCIERPVVAQNDIV